MRHIAACCLDKDSGFVYAPLNLFAKDIDRGTSVLFGNYYEAILDKWQLGKAGSSITFAFASMGAYYATYVLDESIV